MANPKNYQLLSSSTLASNQTSVDVSVATSHTDLKIIFSLRGTYASTYDYLVVKVNNNAAGSYESWQTLTINGTSATQYNTNNTDTANRGATIPAASAATNIFGNGYLYLPKYTNATYNKHMTGMTGGANMSSNGNSSMPSWAFKNTTNVTSINFSCANGNLLAGSKFWIYGISD